MKFSVLVANAATGSSADAYTTMLALVAADTQGYRCRLTKLAVGPDDDSPADVNVAIAIKRVDSVSGGGAGTGTAVTPLPKDSESRAAVITAKHTCTVEPTVYGTALWALSFNKRTGFVVNWLPEDAPVINRNQLLGVLAAPRTAAAAYLTITAEFEEF
jgi:hypothetical protein